MKRIILEMGTGNDLYGEDYTKAACRAVDDALHHSSLILFRSLGFDHADMDVRVTIAVQDPEKVDSTIVAAKLPRGNAFVQVVKLPCRIQKRLIQPLLQPSCHGEMRLFKLSKAALMLLIMFIIQNL